MMANDPWNWTNQQQPQVQQTVPLSNVVAPLQASNEQMQPGQVMYEQPNKDVQQLQSMALGKGAEKGSAYVYDKYKQLTVPTQPPLANPTFTYGAAPVATGAEVVATQAPMMATTPLAASGIPMASASMAPEAAALGAEALTGATVAAPLATTAATTGAATTAAAAGEAGMLAGMGPIGWGIGALMLAKSMKWI